MAFHRVALGHTPRELRRRFVSLISAQAQASNRSRSWLAQEHPNDLDGVPTQVAAGADLGPKRWRDPAPNPVVTQIMQEAGFHNGKPASDLRWSLGDSNP